ncbi:hypothetical protein [Actinoplanes sp. NBRC 103695]|uniref:hypothetical protein n=1 Tax=Actinoplanes sp. NBRC 103695 TaxID=3032202 RepID=UPI002556FDB3|nr:hypothetical protein [Actinoplanes sp. NBRC 103695]
MTRHRWRFRHVLLALVVAVGTVVALPAARPARADDAGQGGDYVALSTGMGRVLNTLTGVGTTKGVRGPASTTQFQVLGVAGVPATNVRAVLVNVTTKAPTAATWLTLWKGDVTARPGVATLNVAAADNLSNSAIVEVGANGKLYLYNSAGNIDVLVDVLGYYTAVRGTSGPGGFVAVPSNPTVLNTSGGVGVPAGTIPANGSRTVNLLGGKVPAGSPTVFVDLQVAGATAEGWVGTTPTGGSGETANLAFDTGTTSSGTMIRVAADGRVNLVNHSAGTINVLVRLLGYHTDLSVTGAGLRPLAKRLIDTTLPANGTVDVAVGGTNGLPTRGIAGLALNFAANSPAQNGYFKSWGVGNTEPGSSVSTWNAGKARAGMAVIRPGTDGKIRVKSVSTGTVRLVVDLQGWFAESLPPLPIAQNSPTSVIQPANPGGTLGTIEYAYVDNTGVLRLGHQNDPDDFSTVTWSEAPATEEPYAGQPGVNAYPDGRIQVTVQNVLGGYWVASQTAVGAATYNKWGNGGGTMDSPPAPVSLSTGVNVNFGIDDNGALWHHRLVTGTTSYWRNLGDQDLAGSVTAVPVTGGQQLFARDWSGAVRTVRYADDGTIGAWATIGAAGVEDKPAALLSGSRLRVFVRAGDGSILTKIQDAAGTWPAAWQTVGTFTAAGAPVAVVDPATGRTAVVARGSDNQIHRVFEVAPDSNAWGDWAPLDPTGADVSATDPTIAPITNASGRTWAVVFRNASDATRVYVREVSGASKKTAPVTFTGHSVPVPPTAD